MYNTSSHSDVPRVLSLLVNCLGSLLPLVCVDFDEVVHQKSVVSHFVGLLSFTWL